MEPVQTGAKGERVWGRHGSPLKPKAGLNGAPGDLGASERDPFDRMIAAQACLTPKWPWTLPLRTVVLLQGTKET